jgi:hypothetical protein
MAIVLLGRNGVLNLVANLSSGLCFRTLLFILKYCFFFRSWLMEAPINSRVYKCVEFQEFKQALS